MLLGGAATTAKAFEVLERVRGFAGCGAYESMPHLDTHVLACTLFSFFRKWSLAWVGGLGRSDALVGSV